MRPFRARFIWVSASVGALFYIVAAEPVPAGPAPATYIDDTHATLNGVPATALINDYAYERYQYEGRASGRPVVLDARRAKFLVANSRNSNPTNSSPCDKGPLQINRYPVNVYHSENTALVGGLVKSVVPQQSDWSPTYCNSAAVHFRYSPSGTVDGVRITGAWDAIRMAARSPGLVIKNTWISNVRDDVLENDALFPAEVRDTLADGALQGFSMAPAPSSARDSSSTVVKISGVLLRIKEYPYKGRNYFGALAKHSVRSPTLVITNSVVAVSYHGGRTWTAYWANTWKKTKRCSNNLFLWLSDQPIPAAIGTPPRCFTVVKGKAATELWNLAKQNWIHCHPKVARLSTDMASDPTRCRAGTWGGFTN